MQDSATEKFEEYKGKLIREIFIDTADEDYVTARWLFLNHLSRQFFWSAAQALEKYLKAVLLIHGRPVKDYSHNLVDLFADVKKYDGGIIPDNLVAPEQVKFFSDISWGDSSTEKFVCHIHKNGHPSNRYDYFGIEQDFSDLYKLDQVVLALRNILVECIGNADFNVLTRAFGDSVYNSLYENNFSFAPKEFEHQDLGLNSTTIVTSLKILYKNDIPNSSALRSWVEGNIKIHPNEKTRLAK